MAAVSAPRFVSIRDSPCSAWSGFFFGRWVRWPDHYVSFSSIKNVQIQQDWVWLQCMIDGLRHLPTKSDESFIQKRIRHPQFSVPSTIVLVMRVQLTTISEWLLLAALLLIPIRAGFSTVSPVA